MLREASAVCRWAAIRPDNAESRARLSDMTGYLTPPD
jgi:hypothetical protein